MIKCANIMETKEKKTNRMRKREEEDEKDRLRVNQNDSPNTTVRDNNLNTLCALDELPTRVSLSSYLFTHTHTHTHSAQLSILTLTHHVQRERLVTVTHETVHIKWMVEDHADIMVDIFSMWRLKKALDPPCSLPRLHRLH